MRNDIFALFTIVIVPDISGVSKNGIIKQALDQNHDIFSDEYNQLIRSGTVWVQAELEEGYYQLRIPNNEVRKAFQNLTAFCLKVDEYEIAKMLRSLRLEKMDEFLTVYRRILLTLPFYHDLENENSYHMMMLGMCAFMYPYYEVKSNRESGTGRSDILLRAKKPELPHMILEFKYSKDKNANLEKLAQEGVGQIKEKQYDAGLTGRVYHIGLAHFGKTVEMSWEKPQEGRTSH